MRKKPLLVFLPLLILTVLVSISIPASASVVFAVENIFVDEIDDRKVYVKLSLLGTSYREGYKVIVMWDTNYPNDVLPEFYVDTMFLNFTYPNNENYSAYNTKDIWIKWKGTVASGAVGEYETTTQITLVDTAQLDFQEYQAVDFVRSLQSLVLAAGWAWMLLLVFLRIWLGVRGSERRAILTGMLLVSSSLMLSVFLFEGIWIALYQFLLDRGLV